MNKVLVLVRNMCVIVPSMHIYHEVVTNTQIFGYSATMVGTFWYALACMEEEEKGKVAEL